MIGSFSQRVRAVFATYWFVPMLLGIGAVILAAATLWIDTSLGTAWLSEIGFLTANRPEGARALLSTVAGSLITVAGVVFSLTMVVLTQASNQFGPRLLVNFMKDRANQVVLGTFVATFLYCLLVLRVVRSGDSGLDLVPVVPHLSVSVALALTVIDLALLVFFFHHTAESVRVAHVLGDLGRSLERRVLKATVAADESDRATALPDGFRSDQATLNATSSGVLRSVDSDGVVALARRHDAVIRLLPTAGRFVILGTPYAEVHPASAADSVADELTKLVALGDDRSLEQDLGFLFDEFLEIALRALSPGINDPFTAMSCIDRLTQGLLFLDGRRLPAQVHTDADGVARAVVPVEGAGVIVRRVFGELRTFTVGDPMAAHHQAAALATLIRHGTDVSLRSGAQEELDALLQVASERLPTRDVERLRASVATRD